MPYNKNPEKGPHSVMATYAKPLSIIKESHVNNMLKHKIKFYMNFLSRDFKEEIYTFNYLFYY